MSEFEILIFTKMFIVSLLISLIAGIVGVLISLNRFVAIVGSIAHSSYFGLGLATLLRLPYSLSILASSLIASLFISHMTFRRTHNSDMILGIVWAVGMSLGILLIDISSELYGGVQISLTSFLFGSITLVSNNDIILLSILTLLFLAFIAYFYKELIVVSFDMEYAYTLRLPVKFIYYSLVIFSGVLSSLLIQIIGLMLIIAIVTIPQYFVSQISSNLKQMMFISCLIVFFSCIIGYVVSYYLNITTSASIVILCIIFSYAISFFSNKQKQTIKQV